MTVTKKNSDDLCCNDACSYDEPDTCCCEACCDDGERCCCDDVCECGVGAAHLVGLLLLGAGVFAVGYLVGNRQARDKTFAALLQAKEAAVTHYPQVQDKVVSLVNQVKNR